MFVQVPGFSRYFVDENGVIISTWFGKWKEIKHIIGKGSNQYPKVTMVDDDGRAAKHCVHRIVMLAWVGPSKLNVLHRDDNKLNCRLDNLRYGTQQENMRDAVKTGLLSNVNRKLTDKQVLEILSMRDARDDRGKKIKQIDIAKKYDISAATVSVIWSGTTNNYTTKMKKFYKDGGINEFVTK